MSKTSQRTLAPIESQKAHKAKERAKHKAAKKARKVNRPKK